MGAQTRPHRAEYCWRRPAFDAPGRRRLARAVDLGGAGDGGDCRKHAAADRRALRLYEDLGAVEIKGLAAPVEAARVLRERRAASRRSRPNSMTNTPLPLSGRASRLV
jgi:hypothetical protein